MPAKAAMVWKSAGCRADPWAGAAIIEWERNHVSSNCDMGIFISGGVNVITITYSSASQVLFDHFPQSTTAISFLYWMDLYLPFTLKNSQIQGCEILLICLPVWEVSFCKRQEPTLILTHGHLHICVYILEATIRKQAEKQRPERRTKISL